MAGRSEKSGIINAPQYMCNLFTKTPPATSRNLRNTARDLRLPMKNSKNGQKWFSFRGAKWWSGLCAKCKQASSLYPFKEHLLYLYIDVASLEEHCKYVNNNNNKNNDDNYSNNMLVICVLHLLQ